MQAKKTSTKLDNSGINLAAQNQSNTENFDEIQLAPTSENVNPDQVSIDISGVSKVSEDYKNYSTPIFDSKISINDKSAEKEKILERFSTEISEIFKSAEFAYVVHAAMRANTRHNDGNKFQIDEALEILEEFAKKSPDHELSENILKLSEFAKNNKERDRNFSLVADLTRITAGAIALSASINKSSNDDSETTKLNSISEIAGIVSLAIQIIASPITANSGYKASFTGHFTNEMADAFERVATLLQNKIDRQEINKSPHSCSHDHLGSLKRLIFSAKSDDQLETSFSKRAGPENDYAHNHNHTSHSGSKERHFGSFLNVSSMAMSFYRMLSELKHLTKSNPLLDNINSSILALTAPVLSIIGKYSSLKAAQIRDEEVCKKISTAKKEMSDNFAKIFNKALEASFISTSISIEDAKIALKSELVAIGKKMEEEAEKKRSESGMLMSAKNKLNYIKDSLYGLPYTIKKFLYANAPNLWTVDSSVIAQPQDLEMNNIDSKLNLKNLDELKKQIGMDRYSDDDALTKFLSQIEKLDHDNLCSHDHTKQPQRKLNTKRKKNPVFTTTGVFDEALTKGEFFPIPDSTYPTNEAAAKTSKKVEPSTSFTEPKGSRSLGPTIKFINIKNSLMTS